MKNSPSFCNKERPPLGVIPREIYWEDQNQKRKDDLKGAVIRYAENTLKIPLEWIEEYNYLVEVAK